MVKWKGKFRRLSISSSHAIRAGLLPGVHKGPFDRMLIAQAQEQNISMISNEVLFDAYGIRRSGSPSCFGGLKARFPTQHSNAVGRSDCDFARHADEQAVLEHAHNAV
jgi:hypothetical protein